MFGKKVWDEIEQLLDFGDVNFDGDARSEIPLDIDIDGNGNLRESAVKVYKDGFTNGRGNVEPAQKIDDSKGTSSAEKKFIARHQHKDDIGTGRTEIHYPSDKSSGSEKYSSLDDGFNIYSDAGM